MGPFSVFDCNNFNISVFAYSRLVSMKGGWGCRSYSPSVELIAVTTTAAAAAAAVSFVFVPLLS